MRYLHPVGRLSRPRESERDELDLVRSPLAFSRTRDA
jgi:hypothetical protein